MAPEEGGRLRSYTRPLPAEEHVPVESSGYAGPMPAGSAGTTLRTSVPQDFAIAQLSSGIYKSPRSALREMLANEYVQCRRAARMHGASPSVEVRLDKDGGGVSVEGTDSMGMTWDEFVRLYARMGVSGNMDPREPGQWGMGAYSYTKISRSVLVTTRSRLSGEEFAVLGKSGIEWQCGIRARPMRGFGTRIEMVAGPEVDFYDLRREAEAVARLSGVRTVIEDTTYGREEVPPHRGTFLDYAERCAAADAAGRYGRGPRTVITGEHADIQVCAVIRAEWKEEEKGRGAWTTGYERCSEAYLAGIPVSYRYDGTWKGKCHSIMVNVGDERRYQPMPDRERLTMDADRAVTRAIDAVISSHLDAACAPRSLAELVRADAGKAVTMAASGELPWPSGERDGMPDETAGYLAMLAEPVEAYGPKSAEKGPRTGPLGYFARDGRMLAVASRVDGAAARRIAQAAEEGRRVLAFVPRGRYGVRDYVAEGMPTLGKALGAKGDGRAARWDMYRLEGGGVSRTREGRPDGRTVVASRRLKEMLDALRATGAEGWSVMVPRGALRERLLRPGGPRGSEGRGVLRRPGRRSRGRVSAPLRRGQHPRLEEDLLADASATRYETGGGRAMDGEEIASLAASGASVVVAVYDHDAAALAGALGGRSSADGCRHLYVVCGRDDAFKLAALAAARAADAEELEGGANGKRARRRATRVEIAVELPDDGAPVENDTFRIVPMRDLAGGMGAGRLGLGGGSRGRAGIALHAHLALKNPAVRELAGAVLAAGGEEEEELGKGDGRGEAFGPSMSQPPHDMLADAERVDARLRYGGRGGGGPAPPAGRARRILLVPRAGGLYKAVAGLSKACGTDWAVAPSEWGEGGGDGGVDAGAAAGAVALGGLARMRASEQYDTGSGRTALAGILESHRAATVLLYGRGAELARLAGARDPARLYVCVESAPDAFELLACMLHAGRPAAVLRSQFGGDVESASGAGVVEPEDLAGRLGIAPAYGAEDAPKSLARLLSSAGTADAGMAYLHGLLAIERGPARRLFAAGFARCCAGGSPSYRRILLDEMLRAYA